jgi:HAD superfamily hydrolase (TIGR01509 family)
MITSILFDLDGVLIEAQDWHYQALNRALNDICGYVIPYDKHIETYNGLTTKTKLKMLTTEGILKNNDHDKIFILKQHHTLNIIHAQCKPDPQKVDMMAQLVDYRKACVTNSIYKTAYEMLVRSDLNYYLEYIQGNETTKFPKPNPSPYLQAMAFMGISPLETLIVEDSDNGIKSALASGAHVLRVKNSSEVTYENIIKRIEELKCK